MGSVHLDDPIAALASPEGPGGLSVVRVSGSGSWEALRSVCRGSRLRPRRLEPIAIELEGDPCVPALLIPFPEGHSYTTQESAELYLPACPALVRRVVDRLAEAGFRGATPGEFTRRAFVGGRIDLTRAESVAEIIAAESRDQAASIRRTLAGGLAAEVRELGDSIHDLVAELEATLDFAEQEIDPPPAERIRGVLRTLEERIERILRDHQDPTREEARLRFLLAGEANAGKSTLFNRLAGTARAITSPTAGTTRDPVAVTIEVDGAPAFELIDLAGLREGRSQPPGDVEEQAIRRGQDLLAGSDPILWVLDVTRPPAEIDAEWSALPGTVRQRAWPILNKSDLCDAPPPVELPDSILLSALTGAGVEHLRARIETYRRSGAWRSRGTGYHFTERQHQRLRECGRALARAGVPIAGRSWPIELVVVDLRSAHERLEELTGSLSTESTLDKIFSRFCLGK